MRNVHRPVVLAAWLAGCGEGIKWDPPDPDTAAPEDGSCPLIAHDVVAVAQEMGQSVSIRAMVTDDIDGDARDDADESGVFMAKVSYKRETSSSWESSVLTPTDESGIWGGAIPGSAVGSGGMDYYLYAVDRKDNECTLPEEGEGDPWHFRVYADG